MFGFISLFNHAFFKALLFLGAGLLFTHYLMSKILEKWADVGHITYFLCFIFNRSLSLMGLPFLTGFILKI
jgi:multicomponent Na+:H+ antiporter subunit D